MTRNSSLPNSVAMALKPSAIERRWTGFLSRSGKFNSRRNSVKHGLTANPAAGTIEDGGGFEQMLSTLCDELQPSLTLRDLLIERDSTDDQWPWCSVSGGQCDLVRVGRGLADTGGQGVVFRSSDGRFADQRNASSRFCQALQTST